MKKWITILLAATILLATSCGERSAQEPAVVPENSPAADITQTASQPETASPPANVSTSKPEQETPHILIAYFTWADNTVVEDPDAVDVDATTSASVLVPGNAAKIADWIQQEIGGDLFSIVVSEPYSSDYDECLEQAADEKADNARPTLVNHVDGMEDYDIVFIGFPNWWYTLPMAVLSFVEEYDFSGKNIVPFCSHGGGRFGQSLTAITKLAPDAVLGEGLAVSYSGGSGLPGDAAVWLEENNIHTN